MSSKIGSRKQYHVKTRANRIENAQSLLFVDMAVRTTSDLPARTGHGSILQSETVLIVTMS